MADIAKVLDYYGIYVRSTAGYVKISCPWHDDRTPSASVRDNRLHCFSCGWDGDAIDIIREKEGYGFTDAKRLCEEITGESDSQISGGTAEGDSLFGRAGYKRGDGNSSPAWRSSFT